MSISSSSSSASSSTSSSSSNTSAPSSSFPSAPATSPTPHPSSVSPDDEPSKPSKVGPVSFGRVVEELVGLGDGVLAWDALAQRLVFAKLPPLGPGSEALVGRPLQEEHVDRIRLWFEEDRHLMVAKQHVIDAVRLVGRRNTFHAVRDYLVGLTWDATPRVDTWLETFASVRPTNAEEQRLVRAVGRSWLIACVARAMSPGCKVDSMLVLEGRQGMGKSTGLRALAGEAFFSDALIDFGTKDACQVIQGVWIHELSELDALVRSGTSTSKAFLTRTADRFRAPYSRLPESIPRSVVFCGTVNHGHYLKDTTGNRRFWTVRCEGRLDVEGLRVHRDALWAEARHLFENGAVWHLSAENEALMAEQNAERVEVEPLDEPVAAWTLARGDATFGMTDLLEGLGYRSQSFNTAITRRIAPILERLGFQRKRTGKRTERTYRYARRRPQPAENPE